MGLKTVKLIKVKLSVIIFHILLFIVIPDTLRSETPYITNFQKERYSAGNKNWSICQDERGCMYFGNDFGLLIFDGINWETHPLPNASAVRSVAVQSYNTVFTGGFEEFGRWDRDISGEFKYTSLSSGLEKNLLGNADFWKIYATDSMVYFQSFKSIYAYDYSIVKPLLFGKNILFLFMLEDQLWLQLMQGPLCKLEGDELKTVNGGDRFANTEVKTILPLDDGRYLIGTSSEGLFSYDGKKMERWAPHLSKTLSDSELNCGIRSAWGDYYIGTILNGIYKIDPSGQIKGHISTDNRLQNNTILSLYEDDIGNLWAGLDRGISFVEYLRNMDCYTDPTSNLGAVYDGIFWQGKLFIGTNQGAFYINEDDLKKPNALARAKFIDKTQGQVWSFAVIDGCLLCCHNKGLREIGDDFSVKELLDTQIGIYQVTEKKIGGDKILLLSSYYCLRILDDKMRMYEIKTIPEPIYKTEVDHLDNLWLEHPNKGVYRCKLGGKYGELDNLTYYGGDSGDGLPYKLRLSKVGGRVVLLGDNKFYTYDDIADEIVLNKTLNSCFSNISDLTGISHFKDNIFWAVTSNEVYRFYYDGYNAHIIDGYTLLDNDLSLVDHFENIANLNDSMCLICLDTGFLIYKNSDKESAYSRENTSIPWIESVKTADKYGNINFTDLSLPGKIPFSHNNILLTFSANDIFAKNLFFEYLLVNIDAKWSDKGKFNRVSYARLPQGEYTFFVRTVDNVGNRSREIEYRFEILPPWYLSGWGLFSFIITGIVIIYLIWIFILSRYRNYHLKKIRQREARRLRTLNEELLHEIEQKNAEIFTQTSFIIKKNELIVKIKNTIDNFYQKQGNKSLSPLYQKINSILDKDLDTEEDWQMFLIKFEQKHSGFFQKLKGIYPDLTANDLKLCACLKLNLSSKEIASLMNMSVRAIENSRYRLRKKLNLRPDQALNYVLMNH